MRRPRRTVEAVCLVLGTLLVLTFFGARTWGELERQRAISAFSQARLEALPADAVPGRPQWSAAAVERSAAAIETRAADTAQPADTQLLPAAVLRIVRVRLQVPVFADTSERNLNRGAGLIEGTAGPGSDGNIAIAAHRDSYFRVLKDVEIGDLLELESLSQQRTYRVTELFIVEPTDIWPLHETTVPAVTLVTCYPFYFVGNAPQRYIVRAVAVEF